MNPDAHADYRRQAEQHFLGAGGSAPPGSLNASRAASGSAEHQNISLLPGEESLFAADFTPSPLLRHIKTGLVVTRDRVTVRHPQYMLFVIRVGHSESSIPIRHVCNVTIGRQLSQRRMMYAATAGFIGFFLLMSALPMMAISFLGFLLLLVALALLTFAAFQAWMARGLALIVAHGGGAIRVDVDKSEYQDMLAADNLIQQLVVATVHAESPSTPSNVAREAAAPRRPQRPSGDPRPPAPPSTLPPGPAGQRPDTPPSIWRG